MYHGNDESDPAALNTEDGEKRITILFLHENAGNLGLRLDYFSMLYHDLGFNILAFAYRGYSESVLSEGFPNERTLKEDAHSILDFLRKNKMADEPIIIMGRSLGGAVATYMVTEDESVFHGLVLENTFTSIPDMVDHLFWFVNYFKWLILKIEWNTKSLISKVKIPILFIAGEDDEIVPYQHSVTLN
jgi:pimeloyl-ACP methyl ester carboxylesterase